MFLTKYSLFDEFRNFSSRFTPVVNSRDGEYAYHVDADLPGVKKEDKKIEVK